MSTGGILGRRETSEPVRREGGGEYGLNVAVEYHRCLPCPEIPYAPNRIEATVARNELQVSKGILGDAHPEATRAPSFWNSTE